MLDNLQDAYKAGFRFGVTGVDPAGRTVGRYTLFEAKEASRAWREALDDHGHTSYWGRLHIRCMRAYWLGYARGRIRYEAAR